MGWWCVWIRGVEFLWADRRGELGAGEGAGGGVQEVQEEVMTAPAAREVDGVKEPAMAGRLGRCLEAGGARAWS